MNFREFVASHTGRQFFDSFREFVSVFKTYVQQLALQNQIVTEHQRAIGIQGVPCQQEVEDEAVNQAVADAFQREVDAVDGNVPQSMPCMRCTEPCSSELNILVGWRGAVSLICVKCAMEIGLVDASTTN